MKKEICGLSLIVFIIIFLIAIFTILAQSLYTCVLESKELILDHIEENIDVNYKVR